MEPIYVTMLGSFDIFVDGKSMHRYFGHSAKGIQLLKYLLMNKERPLSVADLVDTIWADPDKINPEGALKTMVSRLRANLAEASPRLENCIVSEKGYYQWNPEITCEIDVVEFQALCKKLEKATQLDPQTRSDYMRVLELYTGDMDYGTSEEWIVTRSMYLHHMYMRTVYRFIEMLKGQRDYETVIHVCRVALGIDTFDEYLNMELMKALFIMGHKTTAISQYQFITDAYYKYLGVEPSEGIRDLYKSLIQSDRAAEGDLALLREELKKDEEEGGAFVCDYSIFRDIYQFQRRNKERQENKMFLALVRVKHAKNEEIPPEELDEVMGSLLEILRTSLRKGDTVSRYSSTQYALLLPMLSKANGALIIDRVKEEFYSKYSKSKYLLDFEFDIAAYPDRRQ